MFQTYTNLLPQSLEQELKISQPLLNDIQYIFLHYTAVRLQVHLSFTLMETLQFT